MTKEERDAVIDECAAVALAQGKAAADVATTKQLVERRDLMLEAAVCRGVAESIIALKAKP